MKPIYLHLGGALALSFTIAACVPAPQPTPAPEPAPTPVATTPAAPPPMPAPAPAENWIDRPQTAGNWTYSDSGENAVAQFVDGRGTSVFSLLCLTADRQVGLVRNAASGGNGQMIIRTETAERTLPARAFTPDSAGRPRLIAYVSARDPLLDAMALTRGRFAVEAPGLSTLYLPPWAEVTRVIEDCR
ncbi:hypothetical protein N6L26_03135 [Qipengyuania sp. SS22]|uniref:hypothetical protein n=1 Tax=Qipengyuania sp. SS22 TaxID=2979461 RepID=UPI0021E53C3B|nr:hypothetical protein [Qipengyuania sp. SS22]UYH55573.1 hypothetical protein N6L26_03135 [Qipengyuania sp. SS22]